MTESKAIGLLSNATYSDEWQGNEKLTTANSMAIKALEKQIPMIPISISEPDDNDNALAECPVCRARTDFCINITTNVHCWKCGQKIKLD